MAMKLIFAGTPEFAAVALEALRGAGFDLVLVLTQPDRRAGRGLALRPSAVKLQALARGLPLAQPATLDDPSLQRQLRLLAADAMVVAAYGLLLPPAILAIPVRGCLNIHASLLPRWRGAAPIQRALLAGDAETGISIMQMDAGLDTGPVLLQEKIAIHDTDSAKSLHDRLAELGARCIVRALREWPASRAQDSAAATYAAKITKAEAMIDWSRSAAEICRQVRAFNPVPGATTRLGSATYKIWHARPAESAAALPGTVLRTGADGIMVAAGGGAVCVMELQRSGGKRLGAAAFLTAASFAPDARFGV